jgi:hypothetical protein
MPRERQPKVFIKLAYPEASIVENLNIYVKFVKLHGVVFALIPMEEYHKHVLIS